MKGRESGMPEEAYWQSFYDADCIVEKLECTKEKKESIAEFGSGYGTFTFAAASRTSGIVHAFDIEPDLVALVQRTAHDAGLSNVRAEVRDCRARHWTAGRERRPRDDLQSSASRRACPAPERSLSDFATRRCRFDYPLEV